jgi:hypothetical protein
MYTRLPPDANVPTAHPHTVICPPGDEIYTHSRFQNRLLAKVPLCGRDKRKPSKLGNLAYPSLVLYLYSGLLSRCTEPTKGAPEHTCMEAMATRYAAKPPALHTPYAQRGCRSATDGADVLPYGQGVRTKRVRVGWVSGGV